MILVDTSVWIDHLRSEVEALTALLNDGRALAHPFVIGEVAMGSLRDRGRTLARLNQLPQAPVARHPAVMELVERSELYGTGLTYIEAALLASTRLFPGAKLWTRGHRLDEQAMELGISVHL